MPAHFRATTAVLGALVVALAACGDDEGTSDGADDLADLLAEIGVTVPEHLLASDSLLELGEVELGDLDGGATDPVDRDELFEEQEGQIVDSTDRDVSEDADDVDSGDDVQADQESELTADWPAEVPRPEGVDVESSFTTDEDGGFSVVVAGTVPVSASDWADTYRGSLADAGFEELSAAGEGGDISSTHGDGTWSVDVLVTAAAGETQVLITVSEQS